MAAGDFIYFDPAEMGELPAALNGLREHASLMGVEIPVITGGAPLVWVIVDPTSAEFGRQVEAHAHQCSGKMRHHILRFEPRHCGPSIHLRASSSTQQ